MEERILQPVYYRDFHCSAGACVNDCCHSLAIRLSKNEYERLRGAKAPRELEERIRCAIKRRREDESAAFYAEMPVNQNGACPLQNDDGLCALQAACGVRTLPNICQEFPRVQAGAPQKSYRQRGCTLACGEVVRLLLHLPQGIEFEWAGPDPAAHSLFLPAQAGAAYLHELMDLSVGILQDRQYSLDERVILLGMAMKELSHMVENGQTSAIPAWSVRQARLLGNEAVRGALDKIQPNPQVPLLNSLQLLLILHATRWQPNIINRVLENLQFSIGEDGHIHGDLKPYLARREQARGHRLLSGMFWENLLVNIWFTDVFPFFLDNIWHSFLYFCSVYSYLKFLAAGYLGPESDESEILYLFSTSARHLLHNHSFAESAAKQLEATQSDSLAHMALLVKDPV